MHTGIPAWQLSFGMAEGALRLAGKRYRQAEQRLICLTPKACLQRRTMWSLLTH